MPTPPKITVVTLIRRADHPFDPNVIEYDVIQMIDDEPNFLHSGQRIQPPGDIDNDTTLGTIQSLAEADATSRGWLS